MKSEKKYPYIGKLLSNVDMVALFIGENTAAPLTNNFDDIKVGEFDDNWHEAPYKNITNDYLQNTWGVVESKEHTEFIIELAELHGFDIGGYDKKDKFFTFDSDSLVFLDLESIVRRGCKQITIPLPPNTSANELTPEEEFELHQNQAVQAINSEKEYSKRVFDSGCYNLNCRSAFVDVETWPQVGSKVTTYGQQGDVILPADKNGFYIINADGLYLAAKAADITKPKSKQDLLIEELQAKLCENNYADNYTLANDIVNGMIEGLRYEPK